MSDRIGRIAQQFAHSVVILVELSNHPIASLLLGPLLTEARRLKTLKSLLRKSTCQLRASLARK